jgi:hypothetical protein
MRRRFKRGVERRLGTKPRQDARDEGRFELQLLLVRREISEQHARYRHVRHTHEEEIEFEG